MFTGHGDALARPPAPVTVLDRLLATLLNELDGVGLRASEGSSSSSSSSSSGLSSYVLVVGTSNRPETLDEALLRAGRLELHVAMGLPDAASREAVLRQRTAAMMLGAEVALGQLAQLTAGKTPADLSRLCDAAAFKALQEAMGRSTSGVSPLLASMLGEAAAAAEDAAASTSTSACGLGESNARAAMAIGPGSHPSVARAASLPVVEWRHFLEALPELS